MIFTDENQLPQEYYTKEIKQELSQESKHTTQQKSMFEKVRDFVIKS